MSKYQKLKEAAAGEILPWEGGTSEECMAYCKSATEKQEAIESLHAFESGAAELIEPLFQTIQKFCVPCACSGVVYCEKFCVWGQHKRAIETLMKGGAK